MRVEVKICPCGRRVAVTLCHMPLDHQAQSRGPASVR